VLAFAPDICTHGPDGEVALSQLYTTDGVGIPWKVDALVSVDPTVKVPVGVEFALATTAEG
jgi:hypothetical protein